MRDKVLKLCRRLKKCTLNDLISLTEEKEYIIKSTLSYLENIGCIKIDNDFVIFIQNPKKSNIEQKNLNIMLNYSTSEDIDKIMKGFCLEILPTKLQHFVKVKHQCIADYYAKFRELIYENQHKKLKKLFDKKPQEGRYRIFYDKYAFFYVYDNNVYLSDYYLYGTLEKKFTKTQIREFKIMYSYLKRVESHNTNEYYMYHRLAEYIWRRDREYEDLYSDLKQNLLNIA